MKNQTTYKRYVVYKMYPPVTNKEIIEKNIEKFSNILNKYNGQVQDKDICSITLPEPIDKKNACELSMFYFSIEHTKDLKSNLNTLLKSINPIYEPTIMRMKYMSVNHNDNYFNKIKDYFTKS